MGSEVVEPTSRPNGPEMLRQVYAELYRHLCDLYTPGEILLAAQKLIDVSNDEYSDPSYRSAAYHPNYYSYDVFSAISYQPWCLLEMESRCDNLGDERLADDHASLARLQRMQLIGSLVV